MQPEDISLIKILDGTKQYLVPRFQRHYTWGPKYNGPVKQFWQDILDSCIADTKHFTGTIVLANTGTGTESCPCKHIIDGQQRLMTTTLMVRAFSKFLPQDTVKVIERYLANDIESVYNEKLKILPSDDDKTAYKRLITGKGPFNEKILESPVGITYQFFYDEIEKIYNDPDYGPETVIQLYNSALKNIHVISVVVDDDEDPSVVFESLNAKNEPLSKLELIRNFILMKLQTNKNPQLDYQKKFYEESWVIFEELFDNDHNSAETFMRYYLMKNGTRVTVNNLYVRMKEKINDIVKISTINGKLNQELLLDNLTSFVADLQTNAEYFLMIYTKKDYKSTNRKLAKIIRKSFHNLRAFNVSTFVPYLLNIFEMKTKGIIDEKEFKKIVLLVDSYFCRRSIYGGLKTNGTDNLFIDLTEKKVFSSIGLYDRLSTETKMTTFWPTDDELSEAFKSKAYYDLTGGNRSVLFILHRLDERLNKKPLPLPDVDSIEHVFPKDPKGSKWEGCPDYEFLYKHRNYIGNLTISDHNQDAARKPYEEKKQVYIQKENHPMTRDIALTYDVWNQDSFEKRTTQVAKWIFEEWPRSIVEDEKNKKNESERLHRFILRAQT